MPWHTLLLQPSVVAALSALLLGGQSRPSTPSWLHSLGVVLGLLAVIAGLASGWIWLAKTYPTELAALYFCLAATLGALVCLGLAHGFNLLTEHQTVKWQKKLMEKVENTTDFALNELETFGREHPKTAATLLVLAGYLAANRAAAGTERFLAALDLTTRNIKGNEDNE